MLAKAAKRKKHPVLFLVNHISDVCNLFNGVADGGSLET